MLIVVMLTGMISLSFSMRVLSETRQAHISSANTFSELTAQKKTIDTLEKTLAQLQTKQELQFDNVKSKVNIVTASQKKNEDKIAELTNVNNELRSTIKDLKNTAGSLSEKVTAISSELCNLKTNQ